MLAHDESRERAREIERERARPAKRAENTPALVLLLRREEKVPAVHAKPKSTFFLRTTVAVPGRDRRAHATSERTSERTESTSRLRERRAHLCVVGLVRLLRAPKIYFPLSR